MDEEKGDVRGQETTRPESHHVERDVTFLGNVARTGWKYNLAIEMA